MEKHLPEKPIAEKHLPSSNEPSSSFSLFQPTNHNLGSTDKIRDLAFNIDHVIELQLAKVVVNSLGEMMSEDRMFELTHCLNRRWNLEVVTRKYNKNKAKIVMVVIQGIMENNPEKIKHALRQKIYGSFGWEEAYSKWVTGIEIFRSMKQKLDENLFQLRDFPEFREKLKVLLEMIIALSPEATDEEEEELKNDQASLSRMSFFRTPTPGGDRSRSVSPVRSPLPELKAESGNGLSSGNGTSSSLSLNSPPGGEKVAHLRNPRHNLDVPFPNPKRGKF